MQFKRWSMKGWFVGGGLLGIGALWVGLGVGAASGPGKVTFNRDVAPIFHQKCAECHRPGESAPFSTLTYKEVRPWVKSIRKQVLQREMPPWHADPHHGEFRNNRSLTDKEMSTIVAWVDGGAVEGEARDLPAAPAFTTGWGIGEPDIILTIPEEHVYKAGADEYQYFDVPTNFTEDKYVRMAEARPGNRKIVHHIIAFIVPPGGPSMAKLTTEQRNKAMEAALKNSPFYRDGYLMRIKEDQPVIDDGCAPGNERRSGGGEDSILAGYAPGRNVDVWEPGTAKKVPAGATIRFQIHYSNQTLGGDEVEKDQSMVGLVFAKEEPRQIVRTRSVGNILFRIPAGAENHRVTACSTLREETILYGLMPHMHLRGKAMEYQVIYPDGKREVLLHVPNYSFAWQTNYELAKPKRLPAGSRLMVTGWFDNSAKNKFNPDPTKNIRYGEPTYDEMMLGFLDYVVVKPPVARLDDRTLDGYVGRYQLDANNVLTVTRKGGHLVIGRGLFSKREIYPENESSFFLQESPGRTTFVRDEQGEVVELVMEQNGQLVRARRLKEVARQ
jgi:mono/diheme cytochrome c family protein